MSQQPERRETCTWTVDEDGDWHTECGFCFCGGEDRPTSPHYWYCQNCSGKIQLAPCEQCGGEIDELGKCDKCGKRLCDKCWEKACQRDAMKLWGFCDECATKETTK